MPWISLNAPAIAMPNTPWPPCNRSTTSSGDRHSYTVVPSEMSVMPARSATPRERSVSMALRMFCNETPASSNRLTTLRTTMSRNEYSRCVPEPDASRTLGTTRPVRAQ